MSRAGLTLGVPNQIVLPAGKAVVTALFNWHNNERSLTLDLRHSFGRKRCTVLDLWSGERWQNLSGVVQMPVTPAHGVRLLAICPSADADELLVPTGHLLGPAARKE